ncbi:MAG TPA: hypothetical protein VLG76_05540 [Rhabdochlamydiaceae bacterium]|nr:hypothetical protein [Rhabdochlamydiaceae bacterium]
MTISTVKSVMSLTASNSIRLGVTFGVFLGITSTISSPFICVEELFGKANNRIQDDVMDYLKCVITVPAKSTFSGMVLGAGMGAVSGTIEALARINGILPQH